MPTDKRQRQKQGQHARRRAAMEAARRQQRKRRMILSVVAAVVVLGGMFTVSALAGGDGGEKTSDTPTIDAADGPAPTRLVKEDIEVGTGRAIKVDDNIHVNYVGATYEDGKEFETSWDPTSPFTFTVGAGSVIDGWDQGVVGMKVGGIRRLTIPAKLAYGAEDKGDGRPYGPLVFVIKLLDVD